MTRAICPGVLAGLALAAAITAVGVAVAREVFAMVQAATRSTGRSLSHLDAS
jgi:hypothetical protein